MPNTPSSYRPGHAAGAAFHALVPAFAGGQDTPRAFLERCLEVIAVREPVVQAWVVRNEAGARVAADESTLRWRQNRQLSPIDGMPIGIKDLLETRDMPTGMGCAAYRNNFPKRDNAAVWALREAGAVVLGKTVTTELGGTHPGPTTNPFDPARTPGGSSSGSAAAVGAGMVPATIGTQVGGSIIRPASFCGNVALKPSQGAIHRGERQATSQSTHGVHAHCIEDMWQVAFEIASRTGGDPGRPGLAGPATPPAAHKPAVLGVMEGKGWDLLDNAARSAFEQVLSQIRNAGIIVLRRADLPDLEAFERSIEDAQSIAGLITAWENQWSFRNLVAESPDGVSQRTKNVLASAEAMTPQDYRDLLERRDQAQRRHAALQSHVDALIAPPAVGIAPLRVNDEPGRPLVSNPTGNSVFNTPSSILGAPAVTIPLIALAGLPMGIQVMGQQQADARITGIARWLMESMDPVLL
jgi:Asp-tRNA(Asn)/Glu-tRNA(Gln) amidotransferase A subunit family amidase